MVRCQHEVAYPPIGRPAFNQPSPQGNDTGSERRMKGQIRVLLAEDHQLVRAGLRALLAATEDIEVVAEAADGVEAVLKTQAYQPDVIVMDLHMPRQSGMEAIAEITQKAPTARILVLTSYADDEEMMAAIKAGALGYLLKESSTQELVQAIYTVYAGAAALHPTIARKLLHEYNRPTTLSTADDPLSAREYEVLGLLARGHGNQAIADALFISERTVRTHVGNIFSKLHLTNRTQAALYALKERLVTLEERKGA